MKKNLLGLFFGAIFGLGLNFSKMTDPQVVLDFFDVFGNFNPMLLWVFISALFVTIIGYYAVLKKKKPLFESQFHLPELTVIDKRLLLGAALFGIGWGISGYCPAPVIAVIYINFIEFITFVIPMLLAFFIIKKLDI
jgi:uncharacterized membrane protein YedE/YeeE